MKAFVVETSCSHLLIDSATYVFAYNQFTYFMLTILGGTMKHWNSSVYFLSVVSLDIGTSHSKSTECTATIKLALLHTDVHRSWTGRQI